MLTLFVLVLELVVYTILWRWVTNTQTDDFGAGILFWLAVLVGVVGDLVWLIVSLWK